MLYQSSPLLFAFHRVDLMYVFLLHALTSTQLQMFYVYTLRQEIQSLYTILFFCYLVSYCIQCLCSSENPHKQGDENEREDAGLMLPTQRMQQQTSKGCQGKGGA